MPLAPIAYRAATCIIKLLVFSYRAAFTNSFLSKSCTWLVVSKASAIVYDLQIKSFTSKLISVLLRDRKDMPNTTYILVSASKKVSLKN